MLQESLKGVNANYLYGMRVYPVPNSEYKHGTFTPPSNARVFAHGMMDVSKNESRPAVVFLCGKECDMPVLLLYVPDAPMAVMEAELFSQNPTVFERNLNGEMCETLVSSRQNQAWKVMSLSHNDAMVVRMLENDYYLQRDGVMSFLRLRQPSTEEDKTAVSEMVSGLHANGFKAFGMNPMDLEWIEQARVKPHGFSMRTVFARMKPAWCKQQASDTADVGDGCESEKDEAIPMCVGSISRVASILLCGAMELPDYEMIIKAATDDAVVNRKFAKSCTELGLEENEFVATSVERNVHTFQANSVSRILRDTYVSSTDLKFLTHSENIREAAGRILVAATGGVIGHDVIVVCNTDSSRSLFDIFEELSMDFETDSSILFMMRDFESGLCTKASLTTANGYTRNASSDDCVRLLRLPWVFPIVVDSNGSFSEIKLNGVERIPLSLNSANGRVEVVRKITTTMAVPGAAAAAAAAAAVTVAGSGTDSIPSSVAVELADIKNDLKAVLCHLQGQAREPRCDDSFTNTDESLKQLKRQLVDYEERYTKATRKKRVAVVED